MQVFEDLSPRSPGTAKCDVEYQRESSREEITMGLWLRSAQLVTLLLSIAACIWGTFAAGGSISMFWQSFSDLPSLSQAVPFNQAFNAEQLKNLSHLVLVAGHAVIMADSLNNVVKQESDWFLEPYQRHQDLPQALVSHIKAGVDLAAVDPEALLIFSGGQTRAAAGPRDEGWSYYRLAEHFSWWGHGAQARSRHALRGSEPSVAPGAIVPVSQRTVTEDFALDSFQNLMFSLCRFKEVVGHYPLRVTVISFGFKKKRFADLHRSALRFPSSRFSFIGIQPPPGSRFDLAKAEEGEWRNSLRLFEADPYGCHSQVLVEKRKARNPFRRTAPYMLSCPNIKGLLEWCGPGIFPGPLPWSSKDVDHPR